MQQTTAILKMYQTILKNKSTHDAIYRLKQDLKANRKYKRNLPKLGIDSEKYKLNMPLCNATIEAIQLLLLEYSTAHQTLQPS